MRARKTVQTTSATPEAGGVIETLVKRKTTFEPVGEADSLGTPLVRQRRGSARIEDADALGEDGRTALTGRGVVGMLHRHRQEPTTGRVEPRRYREARDRVAGQDAAESEFFDRKGTVEVDPDEGF